MARGKSEHERIRQIEGMIPLITGELDELGRTIDDFATQRLSAPTALSPRIMGKIVSDVFLPPSFFTGGLESFESTAATAGELVSQAEDQADDLDLDADELPVDGDIPDGNSSSQKRTRKQQKDQTKRLADGVSELVDKARAAKGKVAGAAAAAKKFPDAKDEIKNAEASFKEAKKTLRAYDAEHRESGDEPTKDQVKDLRDKAKSALASAAGDLEHLKNALSAITP